MILKNKKFVLSKPLGDLINVVFVSGTFPKQLKTAKIIPIYKKDILWIAQFIALFLSYSNQFQFLKKKKNTKKSQP